MIMKIPSNTVGSGYYGYGGDTFDLESDDFDGTNDIENTLDDDFSEYLWMENEEEFDKLEMQRLEEEALMEQCIEAMLQDELEEEEAIPLSQQQQQVQTGDWSNATDPQELCQVLSSLKVVSTDVENSTLNPLAEEFVPNSGPILVPAST